MALVELPFTIPTNILLDIAIMIIGATVLALIGRVLKQPLIPIYILTGVLLGPVLGIITGEEEILLLSELGIAFLLFIVGLEISFKKLKDVGATAFITTIPQIALVFFTGFWVAQKFSIITQSEAIYLGFILAFSSTMVVVKLLADKNEINTLHGRIVLGIMLVQDLIVLFVLPMLASTEPITFMFFIEILAKITGMIVLAVLSKFILTPLFNRSARSSEVLFLVSLSSLFVFMVLSTLLEVSIIIGAFIAGVALANLPYSVEISTRVKPLRDFFSTLFFVSLGLQFVFVALDKELFLLLGILFVVVVFLKPIFTFLIVVLLGYKDRVAFLSGTSIGQISEFSLIIASQAVIAGSISENLFSLVIILAVLTITFTSYFMNLATPIYNVFSKFFGFASKLPFIKKRPELEHKKHKDNYEVLILGCHNVGDAILKKLSRMKKKAFCVDFDPDVIKDLIERGVPCMYGDVMGLDTLEHAGIKKVKMVISTIPDEEVTRLLLRNVKKLNKEVTFFVTARYRREAMRYYDLGADYVIYPDLIAGQRTANIMEDVLKKRVTPKKLKNHELKNELRF